MRGYYEPTHIPTSLRNAHYPVTADPTRDADYDRLTDTLPPPRSEEGPVDFSRCPLADVKQQRAAHGRFKAASKLRTLKYT